MPYKCVECNEPLIRITQSETNDVVVCPNCLASGGYKQVIEESAGLMKIPVEKELVNLIQKMWAANKLGG